MTVAFDLRRGRCAAVPAALLLLALGCGRTEPQVAAAPPQAGAESPAPPAAPAADRAVATKLPAWELPDLAGRLQPLYEASSRATVINFWATWCVPCLQEIPELMRLDETWKGDGIRLVGVAVASGTATDIREFATRHGMNYELLAAGEEPARQYFGRLHLMLALPVTLVVDRHGVVRRRLIGPQSRDEFAAAVREVTP